MMYIILVNFVTLALLLGFAILLILGDVFESKIEKLLRLSVVAITALMIVDMLDYYFELQDSLNKFRYVTTAMGYALRLVGLGIFITILLRKKDDILFIWIPIIIMSVISLTSYWTHIMFSFNDSNEFIRGTLGYLPHFMSLIYLALLLYYAIKKFRIIDIREVFTIFYIVTTISVAVFIETVFQIKFLVSGAAVTSSTIYYTYLYTQVYKVDTLTGALNRTSFNKDVEKKINRNIGIINIDLDNLKYINDNKGHIAGDKALCNLVEVLTVESNNMYRVYRVGGDEFYVLGHDKSNESLEIFIKNAKRALARLRLTASFGYAQYVPGDDFSDCCIEADKQMYEDKKNKPVYNG